MYLWTKWQELPTQNFQNEAHGKTKIDVIGNADIMDLL